MRRCFQLALLGAGKVAPNPLVGALIVVNAKVIAEGYHQKFGKEHAEVMALNRIDKKVLPGQCTLYVNLEPCSHYGKTPPCTDLIIKKGIKKVVIANRDPNPLVNGKGIKVLQQAGIDVTEGILEKEGTWFNRRFITFHIKKRPYVILKWAQSEDGYLAPAGSKGITWISNPVSRQLVHLWRSRESSILVGSRTVQQDDPALNVRGISGNDPLRIIIDPELELHSSFKVFDKKVPTLIFNYTKNEIFANITYIKIEDQINSIAFILKNLYDRSIQSVMVEGGSFTLQKFINSGFWDEARVFTGNIRLQQGIPAPELKGSLMSVVNVAGDRLQLFNNLSPSLL